MEKFLAGLCFFAEGSVRKVTYQIKVEIATLSFSDRDESFC